LAVKLKNIQTIPVEVRKNKYIKQSVDQEGWLRWVTESRTLGEAAGFSTL